MFDPNTVLLFCNKFKYTTMPVLSIRDWEILIMLVIMDEDRALCQVSKWAFPVFVAQWNTLPWCVPDQFKTRVDKEPIGATDRLIKWIKSDEVGYDQKDMCNDAINNLMEICYKKLRSGNKEYEWVVKEVCRFCERLSAYVKPKLAEQIINDPAISATIRLTILEQFQPQNSSGFPFHLRLSVDYSKVSDHLKAIVMQNTRHRDARL